MTRLLAATAVLALLSAPVLAPDPAFAQDPPLTANALDANAGEPAPVDAGHQRQANVDASVNPNAPNAAPPGSDYSSVATNTTPVPAVIPGTTALAGPPTAYPVCRTPTQDRCRVPGQGTAVARTGAFNAVGG